MTLADEVRNILKDDLVLDVIIDKSIERLDSFGIELSSDDAFEVSYAVGKVQETIKNETNLDSIPNGLIYVAVDMVCGEFLNTRQTTGKLPEFNVEQAIKSVKVGDATTTFQDGGEVGIGTLIDMLLTYKRGDLLSYRKLKW